MRRALLVLALVATGCVTTQTVAPGSGASAVQTYEIERLGARHSARLRLAGGQRLTGLREVRLDGDSLRWLRADVPGAAAASDVCEVRFLDRMRGLRKGATGALLVAAGAGLLATVAASPGDRAFFGPGGMFLVGATFVGMVALPVSAALGVAEGDQTVYRFQSCAR